MRRASGFKGVGEMCQRPDESTDQRVVSSCSIDLRNSVPAADAGTSIAIVPVTANRPGGWLLHPVKIAMPVARRKTRQRAPVGIDRTACPSGDAKADVIQPWVPSRARP